MSTDVKDVTFHIGLMRDACAKVLKYAGECTYEKFLAKQQDFDAICRQIQEIGEQADKILKLDQTVRIDAPSVDWDAAKRMRDKLAHHYAKTRPEVVWNVAQGTVSQVLVALDTLLAARMRAGN